MSVTFGIAKRISNHPLYNFGLALPFVASFYILNLAGHTSISFLDWQFGDQLSLAIRTISISFVYAGYLLFFVYSGGMSRLLAESKKFLLVPAFFFLSGMGHYFFHSGQPTANIYIAAVSLLYLMFGWWNEGWFKHGIIATFIIVLTGGLLSLLCFVSGVLWFLGHHVFAQSIALFFGFHRIVPEAYPVVWPMLITSGYVLFYALFKTSDLWLSGPA